jgi:signal-transduction protein with cAMP-binding, CBS, and nucleotidyltransferase domain
MDTVAHILKDKKTGTQVHHTPPHTTVLAAVEAMCAARVGALLVCEGNVPIGIITERDLMSRVILARRDPSATTVAEVMSSDLVAIETATHAEEAMAIMTEKRCRHLPVLAGGEIVGMLSIGDLVRWLSRNQEFEIRRLSDYIAGKYPG